MNPILRGRLKSAATRPSLPLLLLPPFLLPPSPVAPAAALLIRRGASPHLHPRPPDSGRTREEEQHRSATGAKEPPLILLPCLLPGLPAGATGAGLHHEGADQ